MVEGAEFWPRSRVKLNILKDGMFGIKDLCSWQMRYGKGKF